MILSYTGVKVAVVDNTGKLLSTDTVYPHTGQVEKAGMVTLCQLIDKHNVELIAIGNGTASRETERFVKEVIKKMPNNKPQTVVVSEAGEASVYSASEQAALEFLILMYLYVEQYLLPDVYKIL